MPVINTLGSLSARGFGGIGGGAAGFRGGFMIVGISNLYASVDGVDFVLLQRPNPSTRDGFWESAAYGGGTWVVLPVSDYVGLTSQDGYNWIEHDLANDGSFFSIAYGQGIFVALDFNPDGISRNQYIISSDGANWTTRTLPASAAWHSITFAENRFVGVGSLTAVYSPNGYDWGTAALPVVDPDRDAYESVAYGDGVFLALAHNVFGGTDDLAATSTDGGVTWTRQTLPVSNNWESVAYGNGRFVAIGGLTAAVSTDGGVTWTEVALPAPGQVTGYGSIAFGAGLFVAPGFYSLRTNIFITSPDGVNWTERTLPAADRFSSISYSAST